MAGWVCEGYQLTEQGAKYNCGSCSQWDGKRCRLERLLLRSWDK